MQQVAVVPPRKLWFARFFGRPTSRSLNQSDLGGEALQRGGESSWTGAVAERPLDGLPERAWIDRRVPVEVGLDPIEVLERSSRIDQATHHHLLHILHVLPVSPLRLGQRLRIKVEVIE